MCEREEREREKREKGESKVSERKGQKKNGKLSRLFCSISPSLSLSLRVPVLQ